MTPHDPRKNEFDEWYDSLTDEQRHEVIGHLRVIALGMGVKVQYKKLLAFYEQTFVAHEDALHVGTCVNTKLSLN